MVSLLRRFAEYQNLFGPAGIGLALRARFARGPVETLVHPLGLKHPIHIRLKTSDFPTLQKVWRDQEYAFTPATPPQFIIDAGANIGIASIYFAEKFPTAKIIALEPEPGNFALLEQNTRPWPNIHPLRAALWKENGSINLFDPGQGPWSFQVRASGDNTIGQVATVTIDELLRHHAAPAIDILKMDIEGAEVEIFENPSAWIDRVRVIMVELHDRFRPGCSRALWLAARDFPHEEHRGETVLLARENPVSA